MRKFPLIILAAAGATLAACGESPGDTTAAATAEASAGAARGGAIQAAAVGDVNSPCGWYGPLDGDGDGAINQVEYDNFGRVNFGRWDLDDNGALTAQEFQQCVKDGAYTRVAGAFQGFDDNGDGRLSDGEFFAASAFTAWDTDRSGKLENDEWSSAA